MHVGRDMSKLLNICKTIHTPLHVTLVMASNKLFEAGFIILGCNMIIINYLLINYLDMYKNEKK